MKRREKVRSKTFSFTAVFEPDKETGGFVVTFPAIPNLATQGETLEEARRMAADCLEVYLEHLQENNLPMPSSEAHSAKAVREEIRVRLKTA
ncbi:MAG TPA: type II toxin-antitoxin system HicB family antitoxin [Alphaproteobacteria bacterium]